MSVSPSAEADVVHAHLGDPLPVTLLPAVVLAALVLEDDDLLAAAVADHLGRDGGAVEHGGAHPDVVAVCAEEDLLELHGLARLHIHRLDADGLARLGAVLVAALADDRVHGFPRLSLARSVIARKRARRGISHTSARLSTRNTQRRVSHRGAEKRRERQRPLSVSPCLCVRPAVWKLAPRLSRG